MNEVLRADNLVRRFGGVTAVAGVGFSVREGSIKAVIGPNGAGKSTLFNLIAGVTPPDEGQIFLRGERIDRLPAYRRARLGLGRTFQNLQIFREMSVLDNVMTGRHGRLRQSLLAAVLRTPALRREEREAEAAAMALLARFGLEARARSMAGTLSFGQQKVLELARAVAAEPSLLLLDEPAAGLPQADITAMIEIIAELNRGGMTILLVEHNMRMVMTLANDILVLDRGRPIAEGTADHIRHHPEVLAAYLGEAADA